jgi:hypothetical protein
MPIFVIILIIYLFTVIWTFISIIYGRKLIVRSLESIIRADNEFVELIKTSTKQFSLALPWVMEYTIRCLIPIYNVIIGTKMLFEADESAFTLYQRLKISYIEATRKEGTE